MNFCFLVSSPGLSVMSQLPNNIAFKPFIKAQALLKGRGASRMEGDSRCLAVVTMAPFIPAWALSFQGPGRIHHKPSSPSPALLPASLFDTQLCCYREQLPASKQPQGDHVSMAGLTVPPALPLCSRQVRKPRPDLARPWGEAWEGQTKPGRGPRLPFARA